MFSSICLVRPSVMSVSLLGYLHCHESDRTLQAMPASNTGVLLEKRSGTGVCLITGIILRTGTVNGTGKTQKCTLKTEKIKNRVATFNLCLYIFYVHLWRFH